MKACAKLFFLMAALAATGCGLIGDPLMDATPRCDYPIFKPPQFIRYGNYVCPNTCRFVYEGEISFAEGWLEINCRRFPTAMPRMVWSIDSGAVTSHDGKPVPVIRIQSKGFAAFCPRDLIFEQAGCPLKADDVMFMEYRPNDGWGDGDVTIVMDKGFWSCYSPAEPFFFRLTSSLPLDLDRLALPLGPTG